MRDHKRTALAAIEGYLLARNAHPTDVRQQQYGDAMAGAGFTGFPDLIADLIADLMYLAAATDPDANDDLDAQTTALAILPDATDRWRAVMAADPDSNDYPEDAR